MKNTIIKKAVISLAVAFFGAYPVHSQVTGGLMGTGNSMKGLLDPSRFSVNHSVSFGMSGSPNSDLKSQSLYTTMMQYEFSQPVTFNLNFSLPIHSTYNDAHNLTQENLNSAEYFKSIPFDASLTWQPTDNMFLQLNIVKGTGSSSYLMDPTASEHPFIQRW